MSAGFSYSELMTANQSMRRPYFKDGIAQLMPLTPALSPINGGEGDDGIALSMIFFGL